MWKYMLNRFIGNEVSKYVNSKAKQKRQIAAINNYFNEEDRKRHNNIRTCQNFISIADKFLQDRVKIEEQFQLIEVNMKKFFDHWGKSKIYQGVTLTTTDRNDLIKVLDIKPINFVSYKYGHRSDFSSTLELILDNTNTIIQLKNKFKTRGMLLIVYASIGSISFELRLE